MEHLETGPALGSGGPRACSAGASTLAHWPAVTPPQCPEEAQLQHSNVWGGKGFPQLLLSLQGPGPVPSAHQGCALPGRACTYTVPGRSTPTYPEFPTGQGVPLTGLVWCISMHVNVILSGSDKKGTDWNYIKGILTGGRFMFYDTLFPSRNLVHHLHFSGLVF